MKKRFLFLTFILILSLVVSGCGSKSESASGNAADGGTIKIGALGPMSGAAAGWGISLMGSVEMAVKEVNDKGGIKINGKKYKFSVTGQDSKYKGPDAVQGYNKLYNDGAKFIIGPVGAPELTAIQPLTNKSPALVFSDSFSLKAVSKDYPLVFHATQGPISWAASMVKQLKKEWPDVKQVAVLGPNDEGGWDVAKADIKAYEANNFEKITENYYERGTTDFGSLLTKALSTKPDVLELGAAPAADAGAIIKQARQMGFKGVINKGGGPGIEEIKNIAGEQNLGNLVYYAIVDLDSKYYKDFATQFKDLKKQNFNEIGAEFYIATKMLIEAISKSQSQDPQKVAEALRKINNFDNQFFGDAWWSGQKDYGFNQELKHSYYIGIYKDSKKEPFVKITPDK